GDIIGHIAYAAKLILSNKSIWDKKVPKNVFGYGATYLERAKRYVLEMDKSADWIEKWLVNPKTLRQHWPSSELFNSDARSWGNRGRAVPWNQQMMLNNGFQRLSECHRILGDDSDRVKRY